MQYVKDMANNLSRTLWLVRPEDVIVIEQRYIYLTACERSDPMALRSADWIRFRRALACFLRRGGQRPPAPNPTGSSNGGGSGGGGGSSKDDADVMQQLLLLQTPPPTTPDEDEREAAKFCSGYTKRIGQDVLMMIISAYPDDGILEVDLFAHQPVEIHAMDKLACKDDY